MIRDCAVHNRSSIPYRFALKEPNSVVTVRRKDSSKQMAFQYPNSFQIPKNSRKCGFVCSQSRLGIRASPVFSCLKTSDEAQLQTKVDHHLLLDSVKWDDKGLAVAIAQNVDSGAVLMQGFVNRDALSKTISSRKATFYSRSRSTLWTKGETSMNFINVFDIFLDCDKDSIIYLGKPDGPTCHTGSETCYYTSVDDLLKNSEAGDNKLALTTLYSLESTIAKRKDELSVNPDGKPSWTKRLLLDDKLLCSKIREEADELCRTLEENEDKSRTASEMADVLYHAMVLLSQKGVKFEDVFQILRLRFAQSGIQEKSNRTKSS